MVLGYSKHRAGELSPTGLVTFFGVPFQALRLVPRFELGEGSKLPSLEAPQPAIYNAFGLDIDRV